MTERDFTNSIEEIGLPARLRVIFDQALNAGVGFQAIFADELDLYWKYITTIFQTIFEDPRCRGWCDENNIDIVTWHYLTRHSIFRAAASNQYFSGQIVINQKLKRKLADGELEPYRGVKSPYIDIFRDEQNRQASGIGGPVCILLPDAENPGGEIWALSVPSKITKLLQGFPDHDGRNEPLSDGHLKEIAAADPVFVVQLTEWMSRSIGESQHKVESLKAINYLQASLKVTLNLLRGQKFECTLPRSTFLCPAYISGEDVGGMAFACNGLVSRATTLIGEAVCNTLLSYLRLRENAEATVVFEQQRYLEEAKRFFIGRLSHDIRHPLDQLESTARDLSRLFSVTHKQIGHVSRMVDETILALEGRDPKTVLKPQKREDKVSEFLADIRAYFRKQFEDKHKELIVIVPPDGANWTIFLDATMVHEILENLILNALEHGGSKISVIVERNPQNYCFHVRDNGTGIPKEQWEAIFRPLAGAGEPGSSRRGRGLAIARMLAEAHGGKLELAPPSSEWATDFALEIPIEKGSEKL